MCEKKIKNVDFKNVKMRDCLKGDLEILPLRTLDDFILSSARFQIPDYKNLDRWWNRVYNNLFYYQTNYILTSMVIFILFGFTYSSKLLYGMMLTFNIIKFFPRFLVNKEDLTLSKVITCCIGILLLRIFGFSIAYASSSLVVFWMSILTMLVVVLMHGSLRLRNFNNKLVNRFGGMLDKRTPMTILMFTAIDYLAEFSKWIVQKTSKSPNNTPLVEFYGKFERPRN